MKAYRGALLTFCVAGLLVVAGCGNALDGGSDPSGSIVRVVGMTFVPENMGRSVDLFVSYCGNDEYEDGLTGTDAVITLLNDARPNAPADSSGNTFVTMDRFRVDYTGINKAVRIPSFDGGGQSIGITPDGTNTMQVRLMDFSRMDFVKANYPTIGRGETLSLRADITMWGEDAFGARVTVTAQTTLELADFDRCNL